MRTIDSNTISLLYQAADSVRGHAYAPYSNFLVGAALLAKDGTIFSGCNVENASFSVTNCAERVALGTAIAAGHREFTAILILVDSPAPTAPCGVCRQALREFAEHLQVILCTPDGQRVDFGLADLLPNSFGPDNLLTSTNDD